MELGWTFTASLGHFGYTGSASGRVRGTGLAGWLTCLLRRARARARERPPTERRRRRLEGPDAVTIETGGLGAEEEGTRAGQ